jgi:hypothetical protein
VRLVFSQDCVQMSLANDQHAIQELATQGSDQRSQIAFMRGNWTAVRRILVPLAWKTASNVAVKFGPRVADEERAGAGHVSRERSYF